MPHRQTVAFSHTQEDAYVQPASNAMPRPKRVLPTLLTSNGTTCSKNSMTETPPILSEQFADGQR
jgi:hypothetical protein